jgi:hypothetical protein
MAAEGQNPNPSGEQNQPNPAPAGDKGGQPNPQPTPDPNPKPAGQQPPVNREDAGRIAEIQRERKARQELQRQFDELKGKHEANEKRLRILAGVEQVDESEVEASEIRKKFESIYPGAKLLSDAQLLEKLQAVLERNDREDSIEKRYWDDRAEQMTNSVLDSVAEELDLESLTERQIAKIRAAYAHRAATDPEFLARHERGDKRLAAEFAKEFVEDWFEPARKRVTRNEVERLRPVPGDGSKRHIGTKPPRKVDFKNDTDVADAMVESFKAHGGKFGS